MILVDSSVWIEYFNGKVNAHTDYLDGALGTEVVGIGDLMLVEILQGFRRNRDYEQAKSILMDLSVFELLGIERALRAAQNYRLLRKKGITVRKTIDTIIATFCIDHGLPLLFADRDFDPFVRYLNLRSPLIAAR